MKTAGTMFTRYILVACYWVVLSSAALVRSFECSGLNLQDITMHTLLTEAFYDEDAELLRFRILANITEFTPDVNDTTNMYTTLHVRAECSGGEIIDNYLRFCDYVSPYELADFPLPSGNGTFNFTEPAPASAPSPVSSAVVPESVAASSTGYYSSAVPLSSSTGTPGVISQVGKRHLHRRDDLGSICPLYSNELVEINYNMSIGRYQKFSSYDLRLSVISADTSQKIKACTHFYITPQLPDSATNAVSYGVLIFAIWMLLVSFFSLVFSPYQESRNPFLIFCSTICNAPLLNQICPAFDDFMLYIHYAFFMAGLNVQYPGFYQPLLSSLKWVALLTGTLGQDNRPVVADNIYETFGASPFRSLLSLTSSNLESEAWANFMLLFAIIMGVLWALNITASFVLWSLDRHNGDYQGIHWKVAYSCFGMLNRMLFFVFAIPFLVLSSSLFDTTGLVEHLFVHPRKTWALAVGIVFFSLWVLLGTFFIVNYFVLKRNRSRIYSSLKVILLWGALYHKYEPAKVRFLVIEGAEVLITSIAMGGLRNYGTVQVAIISVVQALMLGSLILFRPYFAETRLNATKILISLAKFITSLLTIPYIRDLNVSERNRTYVAYAQSALHLFVIFFIFFVSSVYCLVVTAISMVKNRNGTLNMDGRDKIDVPLSSGPSRINTQDPSGTPDEADVDFPYYREPHFTSWPLPLYRQNSNATASTSNLELTDKRALPFVGLTKNASSMEVTHSRQVDYSVREVDRFYNASRILDPDPEVKRLWEAREERKVVVADDSDLQAQQPVSMAPGSEKQTSGFQWLLNARKKKRPKTKERSFVVERPRQLVTNHSHSRSLDANNSLDAGSSLLQKLHDEDEFSSETATKNSAKQFEEDVDSDYVADSEDVPAKKLKHDTITEVSDEEYAEKSSDDGYDTFTDARQ